MSSFRLFVADEFRSLKTRESGAFARQLVIRQLREFDVITLDFTGAVLTPSFADEFIGRLAEHLGEERFRALIRIEATDTAVRPLLQQVIARRLRRREIA